MSKPRWRQIVAVLLFLVLGFYPFFPRPSFHPDRYTQEIRTDPPPKVRARFAALAADAEKQGMKVRGIQGFTLKPKPVEETGWTATLHAWDRIDSSQGTVWVQMLDDGVDSDAEFDTIGEDNYGNQAWARIKIKPDTHYATSPSGIDVTEVAQAVSPWDKFMNACGSAFAPKLFAAIYCGPYAYKAARYILQDALEDTIAATYMNVGTCAVTNVGFFACVGTAFTFAWSWYVPYNVWSWHTACGGSFDMIMDIR